MSEDKALWRVVNEKNGVVLADKLRIARTWKARSIGLLNRKSLLSGEALLIEPCSSIHTFFMKFPIDILFLGAKSEVVKVARNVKPWRLCGCVFGGYRVIEFPAGMLSDSNVSIKNVIKIEKNK